MWTRCVKVEVLGGEFVFLSRALAPFRAMHVPSYYEFVMCDEATLSNQPHVLILRPTAIS
jgi:hypothetical protein